MPVFSKSYCGCQHRVDEGLLISTQSCIHNSHELVEAKCLISRDHAPVTDVDGAVLESLDVKIRD